MYCVFMHQAFKDKFVQMKRLIFSGLSLLLATSALHAQEGFFIETSYKFGRTNMSYAYATNLPVSPGSSIKEFKFHKDGFYQTNFKMDIGQNSDAAYYRINVDGVIYLMADLVGKSENTRGPLKSKFRKYDDLKEEHQFIRDNEPDPYFKDHVHPISGGGDYKWLDFEFAVGNESLKFGLNYALGFLGANGSNNGLTVNSHYNKNAGISSFGVGYNQYGPKAILFNSEDNPLKASFGIHRVVTVHKKQFVKRKGYGIDMEAKYFLGTEGIKPYISAYFEYKRFKAEVSNGYKNSNETPRSIPKLSTSAIGLTIGAQFN